MAKKTTNTSVYFKGVKTLSDLEQKFLEIFTNNNLDEATAEAVTKEYDEFFVVLRDEHNKKSEEWQRVLANPELMRTAVTQTLAIKDEEKDLDFRRDCTLEKDGHWLFIYPAEGKPSDVTKKYTSVFSWKGGIGFHFSKRLGAWYMDCTGKPWKPRKGHRGYMTTEERRNTHGCVFLNSADDIAS